MKKNIYYLSLFVLLGASCKKDHHSGPIEPPTTPEALADSARLIILLSDIPNGPNDNKVVITAYTPAHTVKWRQEYAGYNGNIRGIYSYKNSLYFPFYTPGPNQSHTFTLQAMDVNTGIELWHKQGGVDFPIDVDVRNDSLFFIQGGGSSDVIVCDNSTGQTLSVQQVGGEFGEARLRLDPNGINVYYITHSHNETVFACYNIKTKQIVWKKNIDLSYLGQSTPWIVKDKVLVMNGAGSFFAYDKNTGEEKWRSLNNQYLPVVGEKMVYTLVYNKGLVALDIETGQPVWTCPMDISGNNYTHLLSLMGNKVIVSSASLKNGPFIASVDAADGKLYWQRFSIDPFYAMIATGDKIYGLEYKYQGSSLVVLDAKLRKVTDSVSFNTSQRSLRVLTATGKVLSSVR